MELLVATASALLHVKLNGDNSLNKVTPLDTEGGVYFGITRDSNFYYALCRFYKPLRGPDGLGPHGIVVYDKNFKLCRHIALPDKKICEGHQMVLNNGLFHICNTSFNTLTLVSHEGKIVDDFIPNPRYVGQNYNHLNTVFIDSDSILLGFSNRFRSSFLMEFSRSRREFKGVSAFGFATHNVLRTPSLNVICDSRNGSLLTWRKLRNDEGEELPAYRVVFVPRANDIDCHILSMARYGNYTMTPNVHNFTRGLTLNNEGTLVTGLTTISERADRSQSPTKIVILPEFEECLGGNKKVKPVYHLLGQYGDVYDIRLTDQFDWGHPLVDK